MAVSEAALPTAFPAVPGQEHPFVVNVNGVMQIDPVWHRYLVIEREKLLKQIVILTNALRTEVNTQHP